ALRGHASGWPRDSRSENPPPLIEMFLVLRCQRSKLLQRLAALHLRKPAQCAVREQDCESGRALHGSTRSVFPTERADLAEQGFSTGCRVTGASPQATVSCKQASTTDIKPEKLHQEVVVREAAGDQRTKVQRASFSLPSML